MEITVYSTTSCNVCKMIKKKMIEKNIIFTEINDESKTIALGQSLGIMSVPIFEINGIIYNSTDGISKLGLK